MADLTTTDHRDFQLNRSCTNNSIG